MKREAESLLPFLTPGSTQVQQAAKWGEALKITATTNNS